VGVVGNGQPPTNPYSTQNCLLTLRNNCLLSRTLMTTKNCNKLCSTSTLRYFLDSIGRLTEAPVNQPIE